MPYKTHSPKYKHFMMFPVPVYLKYEIWSTVYWITCNTTFRQWIPSVYYSIIIDLSSCQRQNRTTKTANIKTWILVVMHIDCECHECAAIFPGLSVDSVQPLYGPVVGGTRVTITGQYLSKSTVKAVYIGQYELYPDTSRCVLSSTALFIVI